MNQQSLRPSNHMMRRNLVEFMIYSEIKRKYLLKYRGIQTKTFM
jgi:hypothetical protein